MPQSDSRELMNDQHQLKTERLVLRPFTSRDAAALQVVPGERPIADTTISVP